MSALLQHRWPSATPRVLHVVPALFGREGLVGGAERYVLELAKHMAVRLPTTLVTFGAEHRVERVGGLQVTMLGHPWYIKGQRSNPFSWSLLPHILRSDVVHCHQQHVVASTTSAVACRLTGRRVFCTDLGGGGWDLSAYVSTDRLYHGHLHISQYSRQVFGHSNKSRARVILGGVDHGKFKPSGDRRTSRVLFVGRLLPHKGVDVLIKALSASQGLDIVGPVVNERYYAELRRLADGRDVRFHHGLDDSELVPMYQRALCIVLPSVYVDMYGERTTVTELLGQTLLEGMACGTPAVCSSAASMPEIVVDGETGFVVPPGDIDGLRTVIARLADDQRMVERLGTASRQRVLDVFTWDQVVDRCLSAYLAAQ